MSEDIKDLLAVALGYDRGVDPAPTIAAKGKGHIAQKIIELARAHGIEVRQDKDLVQLLSKFDIDSPIPEEAFKAVAEILAYLYRTNAQMKGRA